MTDANLKLLQDKLVTAVKDLGEHFESVQIIATCQCDQKPDHTFSFNKGTGNFYTRYGSVKAWTIKQEEDEVMSVQKDRAEEDNNPSD